MSEFKFSCTNCGQHIAADENWSGRKINCPTCQTELLVPFLTSAAPPPMGAVPPPLVPPAARPQPTGSLCPLAPISLLLVVGTLPLALVIGLLKIPFPLSLLTHICLVAGLVCAHTALGRISRDRALRGKVYAVISLVLGYLMLVAIVATIGFAVAIKQGWIKPPDFQRRNQVFPNRPGPQPTQPAPMRPQPARPTPVRPGPGGQGFQPAPVASVPAETETSTLPINNTVSGTLAGQPFQCDSATMQGTMMLELKEGADFMGDLSLAIFPFLINGQSLDGQIFVAPAVFGRPTPHVHVRWKQNEFPNTKIISSGYTMRLEFGQRSGNRIPGKLELNIPGAPAVKVSGEFTAVIR